MIIKLWKNFSKRSNSTKQPPAASAVSLEVTLKQPCSIESPVFDLTGNEFDYNYAYAFGHYYFITDIVSLAQGRIRISCRQDVLATWKSNIINSTQYVMYSASDYSTMIPDNRITMEANLEKEYAYPSGVSPINNLGCFSLTVANDAPAGTGAATTYILGSDQLNTLVTYFNNTIDESFINWLQNRFLKPFDAIISCQWLPLLYSQISGTLTDVKIGKDNIPGVGQAKRIGTNDMITSFEFVIDIPDTFEDFRLSAPYTKAQIYLPFYGYFDINRLDFHDKVALEYNVDVVNGDCTVFIKDIDSAQQRHIRNTVNYMLGVTCALSQVTRTGDGAVSSLGGVAAGVLSAIGASTGVGTAAGILAATASAGNAAINANNVTTSVKGSISGRSMSLKGKPYLMITSYDTTSPESLTETQGRPLMSSRVLSTLSGFCQCANAALELPGLGNDRDEVNALLNSGIYLE